MCLVVFQVDVQCECRLLVQCTVIFHERLLRHNNTHGKYNHSFINSSTSQQNPIKELQEQETMLPRKSTRIEALFNSMRPSFSSKEVINDDE